MNFHTAYTNFILNFWIVATQFIDSIKLVILLDVVVIPG